MHTWHWHTWDGLPYLKCSLLADWPHGFFTQHFWARSPHQLTPILSETASAYRVRQVHGNAVLTPSEVDATVPDGETTVELPAADGLLTEADAQAVWVCTADCTPVLIGDVATGQVSAIHAGWRGTALKIVPQAIARMQAQGSQVADLRVAMGPAIAGASYQVSETVAAEVVATVTPADPADPAAVLAQAHQMSDAPVLPDTEAGRVRLDVRRVNALQLAQMGITAEQIAIAPHCTYQDSDHFFSYRRTREKKVQWTGIVSG